MHWLDTSALLVLAGVALTGGAFGFLRPVVWLVTLTLALVASAWLSPVLANIISGPNNPPIHPAILVGLTFVTALVVLSVIVVLVRRQLWQSLPDSLLDVVDRLHWLDRLAGAAAAVVGAAAILGAIVYAADQHSTTARARLEGSETLRLSRARLAATAASLSDRDKGRLSEAADWFKRAKPDDGKARKTDEPAANGPAIPVPKPDAPWGKNEFEPGEERKPDDTK